MASYRLPYVKKKLHVNWYIIRHDIKQFIKLIIPYITPIICCLIGYAFSYKQLYPESTVTVIANLLVKFCLELLMLVSAGMVCAYIPTTIFFALIKIKCDADGLSVFYLHNQLLI